MRRFVSVQLISNKPELITYQTKHWLTSGPVVFLLATQGDGEVRGITWLQSATTSLEFSRDKIVLTIANEHKLRSFLKEKHLTVARAIEVCQAEELGDWQLRSMEHEGAHLGNVNVKGKQTFKRSANTTEKMNDHSTSQVEGLFTCKHCGTSHGWGKEHCPACGKTCNACGTSSHFTKVCNGASNTNWILRL